MIHDPALYDKVLCDWCDAYNDGYSVGKVKALEDVRAALDWTHASAHAF